MDIQKLIRQLEMGICPAEFNYRADAQEEIDWEKISYNTKYHSFDYFDAKFPNEIKQIPAYDKIIDLIVEKNEDNSPLKEIKDRTEQINIDKQYKGNDASER